jgi:hypothetical protein
MSLRKGEGKDTTKLGQEEKTSTEVKLVALTLSLAHFYTSPLPVVVVKWIT